MMKLLKKRKSSAVYFFDRMNRMDWINISCKSKHISCFEKILQIAKL